VDVVLLEVGSVDGVQEARRSEVKSKSGVGARLVVWRRRDGARVFPRAANMEHKLFASQRKW